MYEGPPVDNHDIISVYLILNGPLDMSRGKAAAQMFHLGWMYDMIDPPLRQAWIEQGRRVVVRLAETEHVFERVMEECTGFVQNDEGLTEVERGSRTAFATIPYKRSDVPKILTHKKVQLY